MDPIGQTFFIDEPLSSVDGVYVTKIDLFFRSKSATLGVEIQIREVENGFPTPRVVPFGTKYLASNAVSTSADGTTATSFEFVSPVFCKSQTEYFICILPAGGNPDYNVWTAELGATDVASGAAIHTNSTIGALYTSSNDRVWVPILKEDIKLKIYRAKFNQTSANVYFRPADYEFFNITDRKNSFIPGEMVVLANNELELARIPISAVTGSFANGEFVFQSNGTANTATGFLYAANSTILKVQNVVGRFVTTNTVTGNTSTAFATVGAVTQNVVTTADSNTIIVPESSIFVANDVLWFSANSNTLSNTRKVTAVINATAISVHAPMFFSENDASFGYIRGNGAVFSNTGLRASFSSLADHAATLINPIATSAAVLAYSTANSTVNFANSAGLRLIGVNSMASAQILRLLNIPYQAIKEFKSSVAPSGTTLNWSFQGFQFNTTYDSDTTSTLVNTDSEVEMTDKERVVMSRSNEFTQLPGGRTGNTSYRLIASMSTTNDKVSPVVDMITNKTQIMSNRIVPDEFLAGYVADLSSQSDVFTNYETVSQNYTVVYIANVAGSFTVGETAFQGTNATSNFANGTVYYANSTVIKLKNVQGTMVKSPNNVVGVSSSATANVSAFSNNAPSAKVFNYLAWFANTSSLKLYNTTGHFDANVTIIGGTSGVNGSISTLVKYDEYSNPLSPSRYISKNIILAEGQDAEDVKVLLTAYKPAGANVHVYVRLLNSEDSDAMSLKPWSQLKLVTSDALVSSSENTNDMVELEYDMPQTVSIQTNSVTTVTSSNNVTLSSTDNVANGNFVYLFDSSTAKFNVREVHNVVNNSTIELTSRPSFASSNADFGTIPDLGSATGAFKFTANNGICRYVSNTDVVFDSYKTLAVKIVLASDTRYTVPRVADMRTIALQI